MQKLDFTAASKFGFFTADDSPLPVYQGRKYLEGATQNGLNYLDARSKEGFVLMVEGSQIDWGGHTNNQNYVVEEMLDFDRTIGAVLDWAEADGETLVIVTSDHETGGFSILIQSQMDKLVTAFTTGQHTGDMMPVFAYGPGADAFIGIYENTELFFKMKTALGL
jgi:alkaline phosphatase